MSLAKITILSFKSYLETINDDLFKNLTLPDGIDRDTLIDNICTDCGDFEVLYSNPYFMQELIGMWSIKHQKTFQKWIDALNIKYEPLYNYDRTESWTDTGERTVDENTSNTNTQTSTSSNETTSDGSTTDDATTTNKISAYDSSTLQNDTQSTSNGSVTTESSGTSTNESSASESLRGTRNEEESTSNVKTGRAYGNIGVTTSQNMLQAEWDIAYLNIYSAITDLFAEEFCIQVYV